MKTTYRTVKIFEIGNDGILDHEHFTEARFHEFTSHYAICELNDGKVCVVNAHQLQFTGTVTEAS